MSQVELPTGWEKRVDANTGKAYFINHANKKTQWDDPRISDDQIWSGNNIWRTEALKTLKLQFPTCSETLLREGLIESHFNTATVTQALMRAGYESSLQSYQPVSSPPTANNAQQRRVSSGPATRVGSVSSPRSGTARPSPAPTTSSRRPTNASVAVATPKQPTPEGDMFTVLYLKSRFSAAADSIIKEVLASCRNDVGKATAMLASMGFEDEAALELRLEQERAKVQAEARRAVDEQRMRVQQYERVVCKLNAEFPLLPNGRVTEVLAACEQNYDKARTELLVLENARCLAQEFDMSDDVVYRLLDSANQDLNDVRLKIDQLRLTKMKNDRDATLATDQAQSDAARLGRSAATITTGSDSSEDVESRPSVAIGANPLLCKGPNAELLSERCLAKGPDPNNFKGSDASRLTNCAQLTASSAGMFLAQSPGPEIVAL